MSGFLSRWFFAPIFTSFLRERRLCLVLGAVSAVLVLGRSVGLSLWACPFHAALGVECAGCGLTRAAGHLARGDLPGAMALNLLSPVIAVMAGVAAGVTVLPAAGRARAITAVESLERRTGIGVLFVAASVIYMLTRNLPFW
ncbi:hypothetical protein BH23VER1_BH23VER1_03000 [soil metagenome]